MKVLPTRSDFVSEKSANFPLRNELLRRRLEQVSFIVEDMNCRGVLKHTHYALQSCDVSLHQTISG